MNIIKCLQVYAVWAEIKIRFGGDCRNFSLNCYGFLLKFRRILKSLRALSSAGRALRWQRRGQRFDPARVHHSHCLIK